MIFFNRLFVIYISVNQHCVQNNGIFFSHSLVNFLNTLQIVHRAPCSVHIMAIFYCNSSRMHAIRVVCLLCVKCFWVFVCVCVFKCAIE